jgi:hypothetical protein
MEEETTKLICLIPHDLIDAKVTVDEAETIIRNGLGVRFM